MEKIDNMILVLGHAKKGSSKPTEDLTRRIKRALEAASNLQGRTLFLLSGGEQGASLSEAELMARFLINNDLSASPYLIEKQSQNTFENMWFSNDILRQSEYDNLYVCTDDYHVPRSKVLATLIIGKCTTISARGALSQYGFAKWILLWCKEGLALSWHLLLAFKAYIFKKV